MESAEIRGSKTLGDMLREAGWFGLHTSFAVLALVAAMAASWFAHPDPEASSPKILFTAVALIVPMAAGFGVARLWPDSIAGHVWISGLLFFLLVSVHTLDLPTGNGLCKGCRAADKLWRTFFSIDHGSGLLSGDGLVWGAWLPLSMIGYALGAKLSGSLE